jgi:c(7)-type cytochrome triheme protein
VEGVRFLNLTPVEETAMTPKRIIPLLATLLLAATTSLAADLPRLPVALKLPQTGESPGVVTFNHDMHVDPSKPSCVTCHPRAFSILGRSATSRRSPVTHAAMEKGGACGECHGKTAFNLEDCTMCHAM